jgi:hypothetical protein
MLPVGKSTQIVLRRSISRTIFFLTSTIVCFVYTILFLLGFLGVLWSLFDNVVGMPDPNISAIVQLFLTTCLFGCIGLFTLRALLKKPGHIDLTDDGVFINVEGGFFINVDGVSFLPWWNVARVGKVRPFVWRYFAIKLNDIDAFIASTTDQKQTWGQTLAQWCLKFGGIGKIQGYVLSRGLRYILPRLGYKKTLPANFPPTRRDNLKMRDKNYGYHIICMPASMFRNVDEAIELVTSYRDAHSVQSLPAN